MTSRAQNARSSVSLNRPPSTRPVGEFYVNFADNQLGVIDPTPTARDLLPIRFHSPTAAYAINAIVQQTTGLYQAKAAIPAHAFNASEWNQFLTAPQGDARWLPLTGGVLTGLLTLSGAPTANLHAATKLYVDTADATKLPLAGGTLTGPLTLAGAPTVNLHAATKLYVDTQVGTVTSSLGGYLPLAGGTLTGQLAVGGSGISFAQGSAHFYALNWTGTRIQAFVDNINVGNVALGDYLPLAGGTITGDLAVNGANGISVAANLTATGIGTVGSVSAGTTLFASNGSIAIGPGGSGRIMQMQGGYYWDFNTGNGDMVWFGNSTPQWYMRAFDGTCFNSVSYVGGHGAYHDLSDERLKTDITPATVGLPEILAIDPINFHRLGADGQPYTRDEIGFSAQQVQPIIPEAVTEAGIGLPDGLALAAEMILAAAVNAIKTLDQRILALEVP